MKSYINLILVIACLWLASSCSKSSEELEKLIPENSSWVARVNVNEVLTKGNLTDKDGKFKIPDNLSKIIAGSDTFSKRVISSLPSSGLNFDGNIFVFGGMKSFSAELLAQIDDVDVTEAWICKLTAENSMVQDGDYRYLLSRGSLYVIYSDILFIGNTAKTDVRELMSEVKKMLENSGKSIADNKNAKEIIDRDTDVAIYVSMPELNKDIQGGGKARAFISRYPMLNVLIEMDLKALAVTLDFDKDLKINVEVLSDNNSGYSILYSTMFSTPTADFLDVIPASMETVFSISLKGKQLLEVGEFNKLLSSTAAIPIIKELDLKRLISTIDGPVAVAISNDVDFVNEYNYVVVIASREPSVILADINRVAHRYGQQPQMSGNEYIYDYYNQKIAIGIKDNKYVYFKVLNIQPNSENMASNKSLKDLLSKSKIGLYVKSRTTVGDEFELCIGSSSASKISGQFKAQNSNDKNIITSIIALICTAKPSSSFDEDDDFDLQYGGFKPIDKMSGI